MGIVHRETIYLHVMYTVGVGGGVGSGDERIMGKERRQGRNDDREKMSKEEVLQREGSLRRRRRK